MVNTRLSEVGPATPRLLDKMREELEGLSNQTGIIARRVSAVTRVRGIRNAHIGRLGAIFFTTNKFGKVIFFPKGGRMLLHALFVDPVPARSIQSSRL
ncbi:hypothetical protein K2P56_01065 [Patescibacteria group bacterium]|nr:hypothetical protein [Patescibacteria group bacterium]